MGKQWKQWETLFSWAPKSLQMVTAAMKLTDTCSLEEKPWPTPWAYSNSCPSSRWCHPMNDLILCHSLLLPPSVFPSIRVFSNESVLCIKWPKYWSFSFTVSPSNEYSGLISFRIDWFDFLAVQGTLKNLLQHHSSESINALPHFKPRART